MKLVVMSSVCISIHNMYSCLMFTLTIICAVFKIPTRLCELCEHLHTELSQDIGMNLGVRNTHLMGVNSVQACI